MKLIFLPGNQFILLVFWFTPVLDIIVFLSIGSKVYYDVWLDSNIVADHLQVDWRVRGPLDNILHKLKKNQNLSFYLCAVPKHVCCKPALFRILLAKLLYYRLFVFKTKHFWNFWCIYRTCFALKFTALFFLLPHCQLVFGLASWWSQLGPGSLPSFGQLECGFIHCNHDPNVCSSILPFVNTTY